MAIGGPDHELRPKPAKPAKTAYFNLWSPRPCAIAPAPPRPAPDRTCPNPTEIVPRVPIPPLRSAPGHEPSPGGPKPQNQQKKPRSYPFFGVQTVGLLPPHPNAPARLVPSDETEPQSKAPIMSYSRNRLELRKMGKIWGRLVGFAGFGPPGGGSCPGTDRGVGSAHAGCVRSGSGGCGQRRGRPGGSKVGAVTLDRSL